MLLIVQALGFLLRGRNVQIVKAAMFPCQDD
jgi:hypothetical protein